MLHLIHETFMRSDKQELKRMQFRVEWNDVKYAELTIEIVNSITASIHFMVLKWTRTAGALILEDWEEVKDILRKEGVKEIIVTYSDIDKEKHWAKFIQLFGFPTPKHILISSMRLENGC